jgi:hypothetical protein
MWRNKPQAYDFIPAVPHDKVIFAAPVPKLNPRQKRSYHEMAELVAAREQDENDTVFMSLFCRRRLPEMDRERRAFVLQAEAWMGRRENRERLPDRVHCRLGGEAPRIIQNRRV